MSLVGNERRKLTAAYLNTMAGGLFTAGVAVPIAAAVFGFTGAGVPVGALTLLGGTTMFLAVSVGLHLAARSALKGLQS